MQMILITAIVYIDKNIYTLVNRSVYQEYLDFAYSNLSVKVVSGEC